jgi:hypothetical protein
MIDFGSGRDFLEYSDTSLYIVEGAVGKIVAEKTNNPQQ